MPIDGDTLTTPQLDLNGRKGRYGVAYLDAVVTAAGFDMTEPRPGADMLAYDTTIMFPEGDVRVQIKTTHQYALGGSNERLTYTAKQHWVDSWAAARIPVYFVVVVVPPEDGQLWLNHGPTGTEMTQTAAFWNRIRPSDFTPANMSVAALRSQRLHGSTLLEWQRNFVGEYN
jgi:hypothetical protein